MKRLINSASGIADPDELTAVYLAALDLVEAMLDGQELLRRGPQLVELKPENDNDTWWLYIVTAQMLADVLRCATNTTPRAILDELRGCVVAQGLLDDGSTPGTGP